MGTGVVYRCPLCSRAIAPRWFERSWAWKPWADVVESHGPGTLKHVAQWYPDALKKQNWRVFESFARALYRTIEALLARGVLDDGLTFLFRATEAAKASFGALATPQAVSAPPVTASGRPGSTSFLLGDFDEVNQARGRPSGTSWEDVS